MAGTESTVGNIVGNVSDTARWVAVYRAIESARKDALFTDHLADRVAGAHGRAIAADAPRMMRNGWWMVARTKLIDDIILAAIGGGCDRILNLAAGLDTRPYRLDLPPDFDWVEADLPGLIAEKEQLLADEKPHCGLTRYPVDLADTEARTAFLDTALAGASTALVLTEGLLMYLAETDWVALSDAFKRPEIAWWTLDFSSAALREMMNRKAGDMVRNAPFRFAPANGITFFEDLGWQIHDMEPLLPAAHRFHRLPLWMRPIAHLPQPNPRNPGKKTPWSAVVRLGR